MIGIISKLFGGSKSEKDIKSIEPIVRQINTFYTGYQQLNNDQLRRPARLLGQALPLLLGELTRNPMRAV